MEQQGAAQQVHQDALQQVGALGQQLRAADPLFEAKFKSIQPMVAVIQSTLPPQQWAAAIQQAYLAAPAPVAAPVQRQPAAAPNNPARATGVDLSRAPTKENAFSFGVEAAKAAGRYRWSADGSSMEMIPGGPAQVAADARSDARQARQDAADAKALTAKQGETTRQKEAAETSNSLIAALDRLERSPGFSGLGSVMGDFKQGVPYFRNDVKDSQAQLENIRSQVVLATMSRLKALSATGATGFGALSEKEMGVLQNALASLDSGKISNSELKASIKVIRESMKKVADWAPTEAAPVDDARRALLDKY